MSLHAVSSSRYPTPLAARESSGTGHVGAEAGFEPSSATLSCNTRESACRGAIRSASV